MCGAVKWISKRVGCSDWMRFTPALVVACLVGLVPSGVWAEEKKAGVMDSKAIDIFKGMSAHLDKAKTLVLTATSLREVADKSGIKELLGRTWVVVVQRPDRFYARALRDDGRPTQLWFDGKVFSVSVVGVEGAKYASIAAPKEVKTVDDMLDYLIDEYDYVLQLGDLLYSDLYGTFGKEMLSAVYLGRKFVGGRPCHHLSLEFGGVDGQLWVQDGDETVPCRWAFTLLDEPSAPLSVSTFDSWVNNPSVDAARFSFEPPAGAKQADMKEVLAEAGAN